MRKQTYATVQAYLDGEGVSLTDLAERVGVSVAMMSLIVRGLKQPGLDVAFRIQDITGVPAETFASARRTA